MALDFSLQVGKDYDNANVGKVFDQDRIFLWDVFLLNTITVMAKGYELLWCVNNVIVNFVAAVICPI